MKDLFSNWENRLSFMGTEFQHLDLVLSMRAACINSLLAIDQSFSNVDDIQVFRSELYHILGTSAKLAREAGKYQVLDTSSVLSCYVENVHGYMHVLSSFQIAEASFFTLKNMMSSDSGTFDVALMYRGQVEEAELCWARGEHSLALLLMDKLLNRIEAVCLICIT